MSSNTRKTTLTEDIRAWSTAIVVCLALMLGFASTGYGDVILGNFEHADSCDGWGGGSNDPNAILVPDSNKGVTLGHGSLQLTAVADGAYWRLAWMGSPLNMTDANFQFDLTMVASEWGGGTWTQVGDMIAVNSNGPSGWKQYGPSSGDSNAFTIINRDTGEPTGRDWGPWSGDVNKTYNYDISHYDATGATWMQIAISVQDGNVLDTGHFYFDNMRLITPNMIISKCTVTAGKTQASDDTDYSNMADAFTASGTVVLPDVNNINDINTVVVTITSTTDDYLVYTETLSDFNPTVVSSKHKYTHTGRLTKGQAGKITSMTLDFKKGTFAIAGKNINLTGLASPIEFKFTLGSNELKGRASELVINGTKTIPTRLMRMYEDTLIVTPGKTKVTNGAKASSDSLSVTGEIAVEDINTTQPNLNNMPVVITWGDNNDANNVQTFTIPINSFKIPTAGHLFKLNKNIEPNVAPVAEPNAIVSGTIDLDKCTFALSITKADINTVSGEAKFGIAFGDFNEVADVTLP